MGKTDYSEFASPEMGIDAVRKMNADNKNYWGWANGMFIAGTDDFIAMRFATGNNYESVTRALWRNLCANAELAVDVGSHSGVFTLDAFRAGAKNVISVEPHPINYSRLVMNLRHNNFNTNGLFFGAVGDANKTGGFLVPKLMTHCHAAGRVGLKSDNGMTIPVRVVRLDALIPEPLWPGIKAVKIDAENLTPSVLRGMGKILDHKPDLIIECIVGGMEEILSPFGYKFWKIWESGKIEEIDNLDPYNPDNNYNGTHEECRNRFASVRGLPDGA